MRVRCPSCLTVHPDPAADFRCDGCDARLVWHRPTARLLPEQLRLFLPTGVSEALTLDLEPGGRASDGPSRGGDAPTPGAGARRTPAETHAPGGAAEPPLHLASPASRAIGLVTAFLADGGRADQTVTAVLADQGTSELAELGLAAAWLCAELLTEVDRAMDGAGTEWLRRVAESVAASELG